MTRTGVGFTLIVSVLGVAACRPSQSNADTTNVAASSTSPAVGVQSVSDTNALSSSGGTSSSSSTSKAPTNVKRATSSTKVSGKSGSRTQKAVERDTILGYDSVIKLPLK